MQTAIDALLLDGIVPDGGDAPLVDLDGGLDAAIDGLAGLPDLDLTALANDVSLDEEAPKTRRRGRPSKRSKATPEAAPEVTVLDGEGDTAALVPVETRAATESRALTRHDPLSDYLSSLRRYPLLDRDEEHALAVRFARSRDPRIARRLVEANLRLVVKIAHEYGRASKNLFDLVQEGNLGLMQAVEKFDPTRNVKLSTYAAFWIRAFILRSILQNSRLVRVGTTVAQRKLFFNLRKQKEELERKGFEATPQAIAKALAVPEREVRDMELRMRASDASLDAPTDSDGEGRSRTALDVLPAANDTRPDVSVEASEFQRQLRERLASFGQSLKGRELALFEQRLLAEEPKTLREVGEQFGISHERARQVEKQLVERLRTYLKKQLGDAVDIALAAA